MIDKEFFARCAAEYGFDLTAHQLEQFDLYARLLVEWNEKMNLTAITQPRDIVIKHFLDSILALKAVELPQGASLVDVGSGAGFPSVPMLILRPDLKLTLLDSLNKRLIFLEALLQELGLEATRLHARAEEAGKGAQRQQFDCATARAVAQLNKLCEYCLPLVKEGGTFLALKGADAQAEADAAAKAIKLLGGSLQEAKAYTLPDGDKRALLVIKKISQTPPKYPRPSAQISKAPL